MLHEISSCILRCSAIFSSSVPFPIPVLTTVVFLETVASKFYLWSNFGGSPSVRGAVSCLQELESLCSHQRLV